MYCGNSLDLERYTVFHKVLVVMKGLAAVTKVAKTSFSWLQIP